MSGTLSLAGFRALYVGPPVDVAPHASLAANFIVALEGTVSIRAARGGLSDQRVVYVPAGVRRADDLRRTSRVAALWLDPLDILLDHANALPTKAGPLRGGDLPALRRALGEGSLANLPAGFRAPNDARVAALSAKLREGRELEWDIAEHAAALGVSPWHLMRRFRAEVGLTFRQYRVLARIYFALRAFDAGASWTTGALDASFASTAHFSATFRKVFGMAPNAGPIAKQRSARSRKSARP
ncbi:Transcriptional regulator, AraC family protein [Minicystis rosea]|nr:Transcriptional regulator, AraC family protein [Minicystis rosea]